MTPQPNETAMAKASTTKPEITRTLEMNIGDLMQRKSKGQIASAQGAVIPGGHKYYCSDCGGPRVHATELFAPGEPINRQELQNLILQGDGTRVEIRVSKTIEQTSTKARLAIICRSCGATHVLTYEGEGRWMPEAFARRLNKQIEKRRKNLREAFESSLVSVLKKPPIDELSEPKDGTQSDDDKSINELLESIRKGDRAGRESGATQVTADQRERESMLRIRPRNPVNATSAAAANTRAAERPDNPATSPKPTMPPRKSAPRTKVKVLAWALSAPFLLMGSLYALAWRGTYIWPIYYAIQPYWRPFMNEWWFWGASLYVPATVAVIYIWRSRRSEDIIDWKPERKAETQPEAKPKLQGKSKYERPKWLDEG